MYQYHARAAAYNVLLTIMANKDFPRTRGNKKNCTPSMKVSRTARGSMRQVSEMDDSSS